MKTVIDIWLTFVSAMIGLAGALGLGWMITVDVQMPADYATMVFVNYVIMIATSVGFIRRIWKLDERSTDTQ